MRASKVVENLIVAWSTVHNLTICSFMPNSYKKSWKVSNPSPFEDKLFMDGQVRTWVKAIQVQSSTLLSTLPPSPRPPILPLTRAMHLSLVAVPPGCSQSQLCVKMKKESYSFKAGRILISSWRMQTSYLFSKRFHKTLGGKIFVSCLLYW